MTSILSGSATTNGAGGTSNIDDFDNTPLDFTGKALRLTLRIDDVSALNHLNFYVGTSNLSNNFKWRFDCETALSKISRDDDIFVVTLQWSEVNTASGSFSLSAAGVPSTTSGFDDFRAQVTDDASGAVTLTVFSTEVIDATTQGYLSICFDDTFDEVYDYAFTKMSAANMAGTVYAIQDQVGDTGRLALAELTEMFNAGWEIGGHAYTEANHNTQYTALSTQTVHDELRQLHSWLQDNFPQERPYTFSYPAGGYELTTDGDSIETLVQREGFGYGRTILADIGVNTHVQMNTPTPAMPYRLFAMSGISDQAGTTADPFHPDGLIAAGGVLDKLENNGGWLILTFHQIVSGSTAATTEITESDFDQIIDDIAARDLVVAPVGDVKVVRRGRTEGGLSVGSQGG